MEIYKNGLRLTVTIEDRDVFETFIKEEAEMFKIDSSFIDKEKASSSLDRALFECHSRIKFALINLYTIFDKKGEI